MYRALHHRSGAGIRGPGDANEESFVVGNKLVLARNKRVAKAVVDSISEIRRFAGEHGTNIVFRSRDGMIYSAGRSSLEQFEML